jgi:hypothetical protein
MFLRFTSTLVFAFLCLATAAWADFQAGMDAYKSVTSQQRCVSGDRWPSKGTHVPKSSSVIAGAYRSVEEDE